MPDFLKPYIHSEFGPKNAALYDIFNGNVYHITHDIEPADLIKNLKANNMVFNTPGCMPKKIMLPGPDKYNKRYLKRILLRFGVKVEGECWNSNNFSEEPCAYRIEELLNQLKGIYAEVIFCEMYQFIDELLFPLTKMFPDSEIFIKASTEASKKHQRTLEMKHNNINFVDSYDLLNQVFDGQKFFYNRYFNPCLGHTISIDNNGDIKPCLWHPEVIGNILEDQIKDLLYYDKFRKHWELSKNWINECKSCELKYSCGDCRAKIGKLNLDSDNKPVDCNYNPHTGKYE